MDKNAIKKFAVWARTELIARVSLKGVEYGITEDNIEDANADSVGGKVLTADEKKQRQALIAEINDKGYKQVMEEVAYTWFNRFSALRFMEVNGYLPSRVRVFTDMENHFKPQIITEALHLDLDGLDMEKVFELKEAEKTEELYKYLLIVQCNALNQILPGMFQKISDYTELLLPDNLLRDGSVIQQMIELIPDDDWKDAVQIIGWLYQYYNSQKKDDVFTALKKNVKITKENIPAATQLFTPDWIVRYMVENSLGRIFISGQQSVDSGQLSVDSEKWAEIEQERIAKEKEIAEKMGWKYYLPEAEQTPEVRAKLNEQSAENLTTDHYSLDTLKVIDPCCGSGHILAYMFDVLMQIYASYGYTTREAVESIVENNIYGLDIDDRAAQLAYFAVMMKARQYDRRFFSRGIQPHVYAIVESNHLDKFAIDYFCNGDEKRKEALDTIISELHDAKEYGSILTVTQQDWSVLYNRFAEIEEDIHMSRDAVLKELLPLVQVAEALAQKYDVVVTNPPYMGGSGMSAKLSDFVKKKYPDSKSDLSTVCMERATEFCRKNGYWTMINIPVWMFLSSYEKLRSKLFELQTLVNMVHPGRGIFGSDFGTTTFVIKKQHISKYKGHYRRLFDKQGEVEGIEQREQRFFEKRGVFIAMQDNFSKIPGSPVAYWLSWSFIKPYAGKKVSDYGFAKSGLQTGNNDLFLKYWYEVDLKNIAFGMHSKEEYLSTGKKWTPQIKGGDYRKWYGNFDYIVNWKDDGKSIRQCKGCRLNAMTNDKLFFREGITWSHTTSSVFGARFLPVGFLFNVEAPTLFLQKEEELYFIAFLNSCVAQKYMNAINATIHYLVGNISVLPIIYQAKSEIDDLVQGNIKACKVDWDAFEISWDFQRHPLVTDHLIADAFNQWQDECNERFNQLKSNEEELNRIFIDIYGLQDELTPEVEDKDVTVRKADLGRDIRSFISYAVGCMFGRYSLDVDGLVYAGGEWDKVYRHNPTVLDPEKSDGSLATLVGDYVADKNGKCYLCSFIPDKDNIIPICDDEYFEDDIVSLFVKFVKKVYGEDTLDENLKFIADALGGKGQPKDVIRNYFLNDFYADHCKIYQKRPIYWLFDSGKKNGFKCLIYMHRYQPDTIARIRTDYVHEQQARYRTAIADLEKRIESASTSERVKLNKKLTVLQAQDAEIGIYEEKIHHLADQMISINLDDGVKHNYAIFQDVLAKIK